ncbi:MAG TPA: hypothetical protein VII45_10295 [Solirubrobacterales bacterium]
MKVWTAAVWLAAKGRARVKDNLTEAERRELRKILTRSKGLPSNVSKRDKTRLKNIVKKAATGR